jgi:protein-disulfide isomerase
LQRSRLLIPAVVFALALVAAGFTIFRDDSVPLIDTSDIDAVEAGTAASDTTPSTDDSATTPTTTTDSADATTVPDDDRPSPARMDPIRVDDPAMAIGDPDAPLVMVTFESFGCLWCGNFHRLTMPGVYDKYVDTGLLRIESRMMPYEERAEPGALVGAAAAMQDRYWELAEVLYPFISGDGEPPTDRELTEAELGDYRQRQSEEGLLAQVELHADEIDLDYEQFLTDYHSDEAAQRVEADTRLGYAVGFTGTPSMVINGVPVGGYVGWEAFDEFLTSVLEASAPA